MLGHVGVAGLWAGSAGRELSAALGGRALSVWAVAELEGQVLAFIGQRVLLVELREGLAGEEGLVGLGLPLVRSIKEQAFVISAFIEFEPRLQAAWELPRVALATEVPFALT